jgi:hypothetical protein
LPSLEALGKILLMDLFLRTIAAHYKENLAIHIFSEIAELPHFNPDIMDESVTLSVTKFRKEIPPGCALRVPDKSHKSQAASFKLQVVSVII